jgi:hypothetical protein
VSKTSSGWAFLRALGQRWWWLVTSMCGGVLFIVGLVGLTPTFTWVLGLVILVGFILVASYFVYRDLFKTNLELSKRVTATVVLQPKKRLDFNDRATVSDIETTMDKIHGHSDPKGIERELKSGLPIDSIITGLCTRCFKPRNESGGTV